VDLVALEPCRVSWLPAVALRALYDSDPEVERLGRRIAERQFVALARRTGELLGEVPLERYRRLVRDRPDLVQRTPQHLIARWLGVTPESLSRIRRRLVAQRRVTRTGASPGKSKAPSSKAGGPKVPRAPREKP
jgi:CRP/FNR family transcriptional regulator, anaerobic regulatory protein